MIRLSPLVALLFLAATGADDMVPDPGLGPDQVVEIQLNALQHNDDPREDAGIARTWAFAHPDNKSVTGPLERFAAMIKGPVYGKLVNHREHTIQRVAVTEDRALYAVRVVPESGPEVFYQWILEKVGAGDNEGSWMTVAVSPPAQREDSI